MPLINSSLNQQTKQNKMSSEFGDVQNPSSSTTITLSNFGPKIIKQLVINNKSSKRSGKNTKTNNTKNKYPSKPLKVVYISNPMRFKVNADEFQALVQGLTGRDAAEWPDESYNNLVRDLARDDGQVIHQDHSGHGGPELPGQVDCYGSASEVSLDYFGPFDGDVCGDEDFHAFMSGGD